MSDQPTLETARDLAAICGSRCAARADVRRRARIADTTLSIPHPYPDGAAAAWIATHQPTWEAGTSVTYAITLRDTGALIGAVGVTIVEAHAFAELGYWVAVPYWNQGYCTEAARVVVTFGFDALGLHRIQARHLTRNPPSGRVMQKIGMRQEGVHRDAIRKWDRFGDVVFYGLLDSDRAAVVNADSQSECRG